MILRILISNINYVKLQIKHRVQSDSGEDIETMGTSRGQDGTIKTKEEMGGRNLSCISG